MNLHYSENEHSSSDLDASVASGRYSVASSGSGTMTSEQSAAYSEILRQMGLVVREFQTTRSSGRFTKPPLSPNKKPEAPEKSQSIDYGQDRTDFLKPEPIGKMRKKSLPGNLDDIPEGIGSLREKPKRSRGNSPMTSSLRSTPNFLPLPGKEVEVDSGVYSGIISPLSSGDYSQRVEQGSDTNSRISEISESGNEEEETPDKREEEVRALVEEDPEAKRSRKLKKVAEEFRDSERAYVNTLDLLSKKFPEYMKSAQKVKGEGTILTFQVVDHLAQKVGAIIQFHKLLLNDFDACLEHWDEKALLDAVPMQCISYAFRTAGFLKLCSPFLREKVQLAATLRETQQNHPEFANAVKHFEVSCFKGLRLSDQLDCVHARICRYPLLLSSYLKYLPESSKEYGKAQEAKKATEDVASNLESNLVDGDGTSQLLELYKKLQGRFDVFQPGRKLIKIGPLNKQSRKEIQQRVLILFSDCIVYCHPSGEMLSVRRVMWLDEKTQVKTQDHEDYRNEFIIISKARSMVMVAKNQVEQKEWVNLIKEALRNAVKNRERLRDIADPRRAAKRTTNHSLPHPSPSHTAAEPLLESPTEANAPMKREDVGRVAPVWIADKQATMCQICSKTFTMFRRKHHCRGCGKIICQMCSGNAPIEYEEYSRNKVCHECYNIIAARERRDPYRYGGAGELEKILDAPQIMKTGKEDHAEDFKTRRSGCVVDGYILRQEKKGWKKYWGVLEEAGALQLYNAPKDTKYHDVFIVLGCKFFMLEEDMDFCVFELRGHNDFQHSESAERICRLKTESLSSSQK